MLTPDRLRELMRYDPESGIFTRLIRASSNAMPDSRAGCVKPPGYRYISIDGEVYLEHRLVFLYMTGAWPEDAVDHINLDKADNRWANLRKATDGQNKANIGLKSNNTSGIKGVSPNARGGWTAQIQVGGISKNLGRRKTKEEAAKLYAAAAPQTFGQFARLTNPPEETP